MSQESKNKFDISDDVGKIGEAYVVDHIMRSGHEALNVRSEEIGKNGGVDIIEKWTDATGYHEVWHEVKTDQMTAQGTASRYDTATSLYGLLSTLDASQINGGTGNMFIEIKQWTKGHIWVDGWYPKYKAILEREKSEGIKRERAFWYYTTTSGSINTNNGEHTLDAISNPDGNYPAHFNFAVRLPLQELINTVEAFAKPKGGVEAIVASGRFPYVKDDIKGTAGILMPIIKVWKASPDKLEEAKQQAKNWKQDLVDDCWNNAVEAHKAGNHVRTQNYLRMFDLFGSDDMLIRLCPIDSDPCTGTTAVLFVDIGRREERFRYDPEFINGRMELQEQIEKNGGMDEDAEMRKANGWREFDPEHDGNPPL